MPALIQAAPALTALDIIAIVLSLVSMSVTIIGFFASLKFYRDGTVLQGKANDALTKLEGRTQFIQSQVETVFDKTLDAAIGKQDLLKASFQPLFDQLESTKTKLVEESLKELGVAGQQEQQRLKKLVGDQIALIREKAETTRESAQEAIESLRTRLDKLLNSLERVGDEGMDLETIRRLLGDSSVRRIKIMLNLLLRADMIIQNNAGRFVITPNGRKMLAPEQEATVDRTRSTAE